MTRPAHPDQGPILLLGAPRSGTSWLGKIFDSHPDVLYRHEPDAVQEDFGLPWLCPAEETPEMCAAAAAYVQRMVGTATLKTSGIRPFFAKNYRGKLRQGLHAGMVLGLNGVAALGMGGRARKSLPVPDLMRRGHVPRIVVKSVSAQGRARVFARALPDARFVVIVRDPWGHVASILRGTEQGKYESPAHVDWILDTEQAQRHGLTAERFAALPGLEKLVWNWAIFNEKLIDDLSGIATVRIVRYHEFCADPLTQARELFAFAGLRWHRQTEDFIARSTNFNGRDRYYQVFKDTARAVNRWRQDMPAEDQNRVFAVLRETALLPLCPDFAP